MGKLAKDAEAWAAMRAVESRLTAIDLFLKSLDAEDCKAIESLIVNPSIPHTHLAAWLNDHGCVVSSNSVGRYRLRLARFA